MMGFDVYIPMPMCCAAVAVSPLSILAFPNEFNWCDLQGVNYCTPVTNQYSPTYCGACWIHAALGTLSDRLKHAQAIQSGTPTLTHDTLLSSQEILECSSDFHLGSGCDGGDSKDVYEYVYRLGIAQSTCNEWTGDDKRVNEAERWKRPKLDGRDKDHLMSSCNLASRCRTCMPPKHTHDPACRPVTHYRRYGIAAYGTVKGRMNIFAELMNRGPVVCGMTLSVHFDLKYKGGIFKHNTSGEVNHDIEVVGWGVDNGVKYWLVKNTYGVEWGEEGFAKILMSDDAALSAHLEEEECVFPVLQVDKYFLEVEGTYTSQSHYPVFLLSVIPDRGL